MKCGNLDKRHVHYYKMFQEFPVVLDNAKEQALHFAQQVLQTASSYATRSQWHKFYIYNLPVHITH